MRQPIIYGNDDRREVYEVAEAVLRDRAHQSVVALVPPALISYEADGSVRLMAAALWEADDVCPSERFADQPSAAFCSGIAIDDDLVATAGHCLGQTPEELTPACDGLAMVFGYLYEADGQLASLSPSNVYRCRRVAAWSKVPDSADFAVVQLDRAVAPPLDAAPLAPGGAELGAPVAVIGFGAGLPAKVDRGGVVSEIRGDWFGANTDTFTGSSGSPVFDLSGAVLALHVKGRRDWERDRGCREAVSLDTGTEWHQSIAPVVSALCATGWPSATLCGVDPACGDGYCSPDERPHICAVDCSVPRCGDGRCELDEPLACDLDCPRFVQPPVAWNCPATYYGDRAGCDCGCGARDSDCADPREDVLGCAEGWSCDSTGNCAEPTAPNEEALESSRAETDTRKLGLPDRGGCGASGVPLGLTSTLPSLALGVLLGAWRRTASRPGAARTRPVGG